MKGRIVREQSRVRFPKLGTIKIGEKVKGTKGEYARSLDYFIADGKYAALFRKEYGEKPTSIEITFHSDDPSEVCNERWECRNKEGRLVAYGDGQNFEIWSNKDESYVNVQGKMFDAEDGKSSEFKLEKNGKYISVANRIQGIWRCSLTLRFILPRIKDVLGYWQLSTKGAASSIPQIIGAWDGVMNMAKTVTKVPFDLSVEFAKSQKPGDASRFPVLSLVPNISQEYLEMVQDYGSSKEIRGLITPEKLEQLTQAEPAALPAPPQKEEKLPL